MDKEFYQKSSNPENSCELSGLSVSPNPVSTRLNLILRNIESKRMRYKVLNKYGKEVRNGMFDPNSNSVLREIDVSSLPSGMYLISIFSETTAPVSSSFIKI